MTTFGLLLWRVQDLDRLEQVLPNSRLGEMLREHVSELEVRWHVPQCHFLVLNDF